MGSILTKALRGAADAGVSIVDGALAELRQRRLMELQQGFAREDREINRADRKEERQQEVDLRTQEREQDMQYRQQRDQSEDSYRQQTLEKSDRQFDATMGARSEEQEFGRVSGAYDSAMSSVGAAQKQLEAAMKMRPPVNDMGMPLNDPSFGATREQAIAQAQEALENARISATKSYKELNTRFPQYQKYFDTTPKPQQAAASSVPPLLRKTAMQ
jgi:hypothetical protein